MPEDDVDVSGEGGGLLAAPEHPSLDVLRHSAAPLIAAAVCELFPGVQYDVGPATADGFFYNFRLPGGATFHDDDLAAIESRMRELAVRRIPFEGRMIPRGEARALFESMDQPFKVDIIDRIP